MNTHRVGKPSQMRTGRERKCAQVEGSKHELGVCFYAQERTLVAPVGLGLALRYAVRESTILWLIGRN